MQEHVTRIRIPLTGVAITFVSALTSVVWHMIGISAMTKLDPGHLDVANVFVSIARIEVHHGFRLSEAAELAAIHDRLDLGWFGSSVVE
jgi:hypothetical protein